MGARLLEDCECGRVKALNELLFGWPVVPQLLQTAAEDLAPHALAFWLKDLASEFHGYYNAERFLVDDAALRAARLALLLAVRQVLRNGLALIGVSAPDRM
jgi:arginyl-tRNA synthetase